MFFKACSNFVLFLFLNLLAEIECTTTEEEFFAERGLTWPYDNEKPFLFETQAPINVDTKSARNLNLTSLELHTDKKEMFNISKTDSSVQILAPSESKSFITGGPFFNDSYGLFKIQVFFSQDSEAQCCLIMDHRPAHPIMVEYMGINKKYNGIEEAIKHRNGIVEFSIGIFVEGHNTNKHFSAFASALEEINKPGGYSLLPHEKFASWHTYVLQNIINYYAYPGVYIDDNKFQYFKMLRSKAGAPINAILTTFPNKPYIPVIEAQNIIVERF